MKSLILIIFCSLLTNLLFSQENFDTIQTFQTEEGQFYFVKNERQSKLIYQVGEKQIVVLGSRNNVSSDDDLKGIYSIKIAGGIAGILYRSNPSILYALYDLNGDKRKPLNFHACDLAPDQIRINFYLLDPFILHEKAMDYPEMSKIRVFSKEGKFQIFSTDSGWIQNPIFSNPSKD